MEYMNQFLYKKIIQTLSWIYKESMYSEDIDLFRIKDFLDSVNESQFESKEWAVDNLIQLVTSQYDECIVVGGWYGLFSFLFKQHGFDKQITNIDIDPACKKIGQKFKYDNSVIFKTLDGLEIFENKNYNNHKKILVCTACEHIDEDDFNEFLSKKDSEMLVCLQSNNYYGVNSHINCKDTLQDFIESLPLRKILYSGELPYKDEYTRFMVIGK